MESTKQQANTMFLENVSRYSFDETFEKLSEKILSIGNWKIQHIHDMQETLRKNGKEVLPIKVIELCSPKYSGRILERDAERLYSSLLPCRISIYQTSDGVTHISRMNSAAMAAQIGGLVEEVMSEAFAEIEKTITEI
ncbi:DUF302 domain-containing protein [Parabacteroides sp. PF5-9]|jgi:uncharacterized protein (DUF302 family)|uniref:DUF302 domain-containing protein n=1 Tax=Parabacteroides sp. PF5-9 TaxID=1742404 RepID=UPI0024772746|nr:DUF302 domain-containing protein [Parabacteroides sp. PF5-9]MDH6357018.1 uncharacterized protein (DUF302 family) [Parabacteroides sp. PF5-9]MDL2223055.1 DUF302 domain-containing protein [Bacteroidales bacterium OttesenSCG-928-M11]